MSWLRKKEHKILQALHGKSFFKREASNAGVVNSGSTWTDRLPHPANMNKYDGLNSKPEVHIAIELLTHLIAPNIYVQMPETDDSGKEIDPKHANVKTVERWIRDRRFRSKYQQIVRTKIGNGFCPVEILPDKSLKLLPSETFYIWRDKFGRTYRYTQEINNQEIARWEKSGFRESFRKIEKFYTQQERDIILKEAKVPVGNFDDIVLFIHNEDPAHPYGVAISDSIADLIQARDQLNVDMPKVIHRFSAPTMTFTYDGDISPIKQAVEDKDVDEALYLGGIMPDTLKIDFHEPDPRVKFTEYIEQVNFQIAEELHAPLILLLKNATEASATKMLESVDRYVQSEQDENAEIIEQTIFKRLVGDPTPEFLHGAPNSVLNDVTLDQIGTLQGNKTITWKQAQDLIRKKGLDLIEDVEPKPEPIFKKPPTDDEGKPLLNSDKINSLELRLQTIRNAYECQPQKMLLSEALREGDRAITGYVEKAKMEASHQLKALGRCLTPESEQHFKLVHDVLFSEFRDSMLPLELRKN